MANQKKPRIIIREIRKNIKVTEISKEPQVEQEEKEETLEDLTADAPSPRAFPQLTGPVSQIRAEQPTEAEPKAEEEKKPEERGPVYEVHNISEEEIRRVYESREEAVRQPGERVVNPMLMSSRDQQESSLRNREVEAIRTPREEEKIEKYKVTAPEGRSSKRKLPWEA